MPLDWMKLNIPISGGLSEGVAELARPMGRLVDCKNGVFDKTGHLAKRNGFSKLSIRKVEDGTNIQSARLIHSTGKELCLVDQQNLRAFDDGQAKWYDRGIVSPFCGKQDNVFSGVKTFGQCDMHEANGVILYAALAAYRIDYGGNDFRWLVEVIATDHDGNILGGPWEIAPTTTEANRPTGVRICPIQADNPTKLLLFYEVAYAGATTIGRLEYDTTDPSTVPGSYAAVTTNRDGADYRNFDAVAMTGGYAAGWVDDTNSEVFLRIYNTSHSVQSSGTITDTDPYQFVAMSWDETNSQLYVMTVTKYLGDPITPNVIELHAFDDDDVVVGTGRNWLRSGASPVNQAAVPNDERVQNIACCVGDNGSGTERVVCVWNQYESQGDSVEFTMHNRSFRYSDGLDADAEIVVYNCMPTTRPWFHGNKCYVCAASTNYRIPYECAGIFDLRPDEVPHGGAARLPHLVGYHDPGTGFWGGVFFGATHNVVEVSSGVWKTVSTSLGFYYAERYTEKFVYNTDCITMDFTLTPLAVTILGGATIIGGGFVAYYDTASVFELGYAMPYVIYSNGEGTAPANLSISTEQLSPAPPVTLSQDFKDSAGLYQYFTVPEGYDALGILHRGMPSPYEQDTDLGGVGYWSASENAIIIYVKTHPFTNRLPGRYDNCVFYKRGPDLTPKRFMQHNLFLENEYDTSYYMDKFWDFGQNHIETTGGAITANPSGPQLYTYGGELEAVMPEGARFPVVARERLWLLDFFRRDRIQFSKPIAPGTATETVLAPEFNEGFGKVVPDGNRITGAAEMDDRLIIFTEESIYMMAGFGPDNDGTNNDYSEMALVNNESGCIEGRSICSFPGGLLFESEVGLSLLTRGLDVKYIGSDVEDKLSDYPVITSAVLVADSSEVRFTCTNAAQLDGIILVFNYREDAWTWWHVVDSSDANMVPISACIHNGTYYVAEVDGQVWYENILTAYDDITKFQPLDVKLSWFQGPEQARWMKVRYIVPTIEQLDPIHLHAYMYRNFDDSLSVDKTWSEQELTSFEGSSVKQPKWHVPSKKVQSFMFHIYDSESLGTTTGKGYTLEGVQFEIGMKKGLYKPKPENRG